MITGFFQAQSLCCIAINVLEGNGVVA